MEDGNSKSDINDDVRVDDRSSSADDDDDDDNDTSTSTSTSTSTITTSRIAFGSCHKSEKSATPPIWETIIPLTSNSDSNSDSNINDDGKNKPLDAWLWLGDAMYPTHRDPITNKKYYGPAPPEEVEVGLRDMKHENETIGYKGFLNRLMNTSVDNDDDNDDDNNDDNNNNNHNPIVTGVWDDHDFGGNDMGSKMPKKKERQAIYREFLGHDDGNNNKFEYNNDNDNNNNNKDDDDTDKIIDGMYHRVDMENGKIRILVLDTRWFREDHCIPSVAHRMPKGNAVACLTRWLTSVRIHSLSVCLSVCVRDLILLLLL